MPLQPAAVAAGAALRTPVPSTVIAGALPRRRVLNAVCGCAGSPFVAEAASSTVLQQQQMLSEERFQVVTHARLREACWRLRACMGLSRILGVDAKATGALIEAGNGQPRVTPGVDDGSTRTETRKPGNKRPTQKPKPLRQAARRSYCTTSPAARTAGGRIASSAEVQVVQPLPQVQACEVRLEVPRAIPWAADEG